MGGNFPAGKREGRDGREGPPIFGTPGTSRGKDQRSTGNPPGRQSLLKIEIITKNRSLLKYLLIITSSILARFGRF